MNAREKVALHEFSTNTLMDPDAIRKAASRAAEVGKRFMTSTVVEEAVREKQIDYVIKGPGGIVKQMGFTVAWTDPATGQRRVSLTVGDFITTQSTVAGFIPVGPKDAPALGSLKRFSAALREELS